MTMITNTTSKTPKTTSTTPNTASTTPITITTTPTTVSTTSITKHGWCNLDNYEIAVQQRLNSSKDIIVVDEIDDNTYEKSKSVCEDICGRLYLPSTLKENDELESVLVGHLKNYGYWTNDVWLRMTYNETAGTWYDPDNKKDLTFLKFHPYDEFRDCSATCCNQYCGDAKEHHAVMDHNGEWWSRADNNEYSEYVFCELT